MICDTSGLLSALLADQPHHELCLSALNEAEILVVPQLTLCEIDYLATTRHGRRASASILAELTQPEYELVEIRKEDLAIALDVMRTYEDLNVGLTDASLVVLAKRYKTNEILTLDQRHFRAMRGLDGRHFRLLPFDME